MSIFDLNFTRQNSKMIYLPVPWDVTTSYHAGTSQGPQAILEASAQLDLYDFEVNGFTEVGFYMTDEHEPIHDWNKEGRKLVEQINNEDLSDSESSAKIKRVNELSARLNEWVYTQSKAILSEGKFLGIVGGDHSVPYGAIRALSEREPSFGILHFDAHFDLRNAYQGFQHSHASIMHNVVSDFPQIKKLVQVGIRDFCKEEKDFADSQPHRLYHYTDERLNTEKFMGKNWQQICKEIISFLPEKVWISFDVDGLDPKLCPGTGTPVPGGLEFAEAVFLINQVQAAKKEIIGFDLVEVAPSRHSDWDANVGMRLLFALSKALLLSRRG